MDLEPKIIAATLPNEPDRLDKRLIQALAGLAILLGLGFIYLTFITYWSDSEIWGISLAKKFWTIERENTSIYFKSLFYAILSIPYRFPLGNAATFDAARAIFCLVGLGNLFLIFKITRQASSDQRAPWLVLLLILGNTSFLNQGFRARSDVLSLFFFLSAIYVLLANAQEHPNFRSRSAFIVYPVLTLFLLLTTPKAILFWGALALLNLLLIRMADQEGKKFLWACFLYSLVIPVFTLAAVLVRFYLETKKMVSTEGSNAVMAYQRAYRYLADSSVRVNFFDLDDDRLHFFWQSVERNPEAYILISSAVAFGLFRFIWKRKLSLPFALEIVTLALLTVGYFSSDILPFFIGSLLPLPLLCGAIFFLGFTTHLPRLLGRSLLVVLALALFVKGVDFARLNALENNNFHQRSAIRKLEAYFAQYSVREHYDVIGLLPRQNTIYRFLGPSQGSQNRLSIVDIQRIRPAFVLFVRKLLLVDSLVTPYLVENYLDLGYGLFGHAYRFKLNANDSPVRVREIAGKPRLNIDWAKIEALWQERYGYPLDTNVRVLFDSPGAEPPLALQRNKAEGDPVAPKDLKSIWITPYAPIDLEQEGTLMFVFAFDENF